MYVLYIIPNLQTVGMVWKQNVQSYSTSGLKCLRKLGEGASSVVTLYYNEKTDEYLAVKVCNGAVVNDLFQKIITTEKANRDQMVHETASMNKCTSQLYESNGSLYDQCCGAERH